MNVARERASTRKMVSTASTGTLCHTSQKNR